VQPGLPPRIGAILTALLTLTGCAEHPQLVMVNPRTGASVDCPVPDTLAGSGEFLISRACLSACVAHGFRPVPGPHGPQTQMGRSTDETPSVCLD
jgi:hypothetical protein